jgi:hypothetical protein
LHTEVSHFSALKTAPQRENIQKISKNEKLRSQSGSSGLDAKDLLSAALAYFSAKQSGQSNMQSIMQAISAASRFSGSPDRAQSGAVVVNTILNMIGSN